MNNIKFLQIGIVILFLVNFCILGFVWFTKPPQNNGRMAAEFLIKELSLNEKQITTFNQMAQAHHAQIMPLRKKGSEARTHYFSFLGKEKMDSLAIQQALDSILWAQKQTEQVTFNHFSEVRKICDKDQQKKFDEVIHQALKMMRPAPPQNKAQK